MNPKFSSGFTILELLVNIAIISILAAIAIPGYITFRDRAKIAQAKSDLHNIHLAIEQLANDTNKWPGPRRVGSIRDDEEGKEVWDLNLDKGGLVKATSSFPNWKGPYLQSVPKDPWGMDYFFDPGYLIGGKRYAVIGSFGPNKCCQNTFDSDNVYLILASE